MCSSPVPGSPKSLLPVTVCMLMAHRRYAVAGAHLVHVSGVEGRARQVAHLDPRFGKLRADEARPHADDLKSIWHVSTCTA